MGYNSAGLRDFWRYYGDGPLDAQGRPVIKEGLYPNADGQQKHVDNIGTWRANDADVRM